MKRTQMFFFKWKYMATGGLHILKDYIEDIDACCNNFRQYRKIKRAPYFLAKMLNSY